MKSLNLNKISAIKKLLSVYPIASPNLSFSKQLDLYWELGCILDLNNKKYKIFNLKSQINQYAYGRINFENIAQQVVEEQTETLFRCRSCSRLLATSKNLVHPWPIEKSNKNPKYRSNSIQSLAIDSTDCTLADNGGQGGDNNSIFVEPLTWMKDQVQVGEVRGKLYCPNCLTKLGHFNWAGFDDGNGVHLTPGMRLHLNKLDVREISGLAIDNITISIRQPKLT